MKLYRVWPWTSINGNFKNTRSAEVSIPTLAVNSCIVGHACPVQNPAVVLDRSDNAKKSKRVALLIGEGLRAKHSSPTREDLPAGARRLTRSGAAAASASSERVQRGERLQRAMLTRRAGH